MKNITSLIDHTFLRQDAQEVEIKNTCIEAVKNNFFSVFVNPVYVPYAASLLNSSEVKIGTTIGFPVDGLNKLFVDIIRTRASVCASIDSGTCTAI